LPLQKLKTINTNEDAVHATGERTIERNVREAGRLSGNAREADKDEFTSPGG
jgi:hypothetical protein